MDKATAREQPDEGFVLCCVVLLCVAVYATHQILPGEHVRHDGVGVGHADQVRRPSEAHLHGVLRRLHVGGVCRREGGKEGGSCWELRLRPDRRLITGQVVSLLRLNYLYTCS